MTRRLAAVVMALHCATRAFAGGAVNFDQGLDLSGRLRGLRQDASAMLGVASGQPLFDWSTDLKIVSFGPEAGPLSAPVTLVSDFIDNTECDGGGPPDPLAGQCGRTPYHISRKVRVRLVDRGPILPWEYDSVWIRLIERRLSAEVARATHEYEMTLPGTAGDVIELRAGRKILSPPDPKGIAVESFGYEPAEKSLVLRLSDKWAGHYAGERTEVLVRLIRDRWIWDRLVLEKTVSFPAARLYAVRFEDFRSEFKRELEPGGEYIVQWEFRRAGSTSLDGWQWRSPTLPARHP